jgi:ATP-binding cassette subfamily B protein
VAAAESNPAMETDTPESFRKAWKERLKALRNIPPVLHMVWQSGHKVVACNIFLRVLSAFAPVAMLAVTGLIMHTIVAVATGKQPLGATLWWLVALEFLLAGLNSVLCRLIDYYDLIFADKFTLHVSTRIMEHASNLDLATYENPTFHDKLERARAQSTDRLNMIQAMGRMLQQAIIAISLSVGIFWFSPWLLLILIACVVPAFLGESHFAFLGYSLNVHQTPVRRQLDYLRVLGASKEAAKELRLFGLSRFFTGLFSHLSLGIYEQNVALAKRRLLASSSLSLLSTIGYPRLPLKPAVCTLCLPL